MRHRFFKCGLSQKPKGRTQLPMKRISIAYFLLAVFVLSGCVSGGDDGGITPNPTKISVDNVGLLDLNNNANASDFRITFTPSENEAFVTEYRVFIAKASRISEITQSELEGLTSSRYQVINPIDANIRAFMSSALVDVEGLAIEEGVSYQAIIMSIADGSNVQANQLSYSNAIILAQASFLEVIAELPIGTGGLEVDDQGNVYLGDFGESLSGDPGTTVYKVAPDGTQSIFASGLVGASGNTFGPDGNLYQSNIQGGKVSKILPDGTKSDYVTGMSSPVGLVFNNAGDLFVANCGNNMIKKVTPQGEVSTFADGSLFSCPNGITMDDNENIYVANFSNDNVIKITPDGQSSVFASFNGGNNGHITYFNGNLYVVARAANQIYQLDLEGNLELLVGSGQRGHGEGALFNASLSLPNDLHFSADGKYLYINDAKPTIGTPAESAIKPTYLKRITFVQ